MSTIISKNEYKRRNNEYNKKKYQEKLKEEGKLSKKGGRYWLPVLLLIYVSVRGLHGVFTRQDFSTKGQWYSEQRCRSRSWPWHLQSAAVWRPFPWLRATDFKRSLRGPEMWCGWEESCSARDSYAPALSTAWPCSMWHTHFSAVFKFPLPIPLQS